MVKVASPLPAVIGNGCAATFAVLHLLDRRLGLDDFHHWAREVVGKMHF